MFGRWFSGLLSRLGVASAILGGWAVALAAPAAAECLLSAGGVVCFSSAAPLTIIGPDGETDNSTAAVNEIDRDFLETHTVVVPLGWKIIERGNQYVVVRDKTAEQQLVAETAVPRTAAEVAAPAKKGDAPPPPAPEKGRK